ncbi:MAG: O-antigen ligase family protein [Verrucomicrobiota bacterium]
MVEKPPGLLEMVFWSWPISWGYLILALVGVALVRWIRFPKNSPRWLIVLPVLWLGWQFVANIKSVDGRLSSATLNYFISCTVAYYIGFLVLSRAQSLKWFFWPILVGFVLVLWSGFEQHYGGLEAVRRLVYEQPDWQTRYPPEYLFKIGSNRIFATLVYPNALAGAILLYLPVLVLIAWQVTARWSQNVRLVAVGLFLYAALACLFWSGSKAGWLIAVLIIVVGLLHQPLGRKWKWIIAALVLGVGLIAFAVKFSAYFQQGARSVGARVIYWQTAWAIALEHPVFGTGPGTFSKLYQRMKPPGAEMARLTHNDYLEQACDSGFPGFLAYAALFCGSLIWLYRKSRTTKTAVPFVIWLGLLGWSLQSFVEFSLYIPALGWPVFTLFGWAAGFEPENGMDKETRAA